MCPSSGKTSLLQTSLQAFKLPGIQNTTVCLTTPVVACDKMAVEPISSVLNWANNDPNAVSSLENMGLTDSLVISLFAMPAPQIKSKTLDFSSSITFCAVPIRDEICSKQYFQIFFSFDLMTTKFCKSKRSGLSKKCGYHISNRKIKVCQISYKYRLSLSSI